MSRLEELTGAAVMGAIIGASIAVLAHLTLDNPREPVSFKECETKTIIMEFPTGERIICSPGGQPPPPPPPKKPTAA